MSNTTVNLNLPPDLYDELASIAEVSPKMSLEDVVLQTVRAGMPPSLGKVPQLFHDELMPLNALGDMDLLRIVEGDWPLPDDNGDDDMFRKFDFAALRTTYASKLLRWRGHPVPIPYEM